MMTRLFWLALVMAFFTPPQDVFAEKESSSPSATAAIDDAEASYADVIEGDDVYEGLFTFYRDRESGDVTLSLDPEQFDNEYIYFIHIEDGVVDAGSFRGAYGPRFVFTLERRFDKVAIVRENTACLLYTSPSPRDATLSRMPSSA